MALYEFAVLGNPSLQQLSELEEQIQKQLSYFQLFLGKDIDWLVQPDHFAPNPAAHTGIVFYGAKGFVDAEITQLYEQGISIVPVVSKLENVPQEIPEKLRNLNCLAYDQRGTARIVTALLENVGLLPKKRRVFISYVRSEAREAALQLFDTLSANEFSVFLDTHNIPAAEDFQATLWHNHHDSDVLVMLHTAGYFESKFARAEFEKAISKGIPILRIGWPGSKESLSELDQKIIDTAYSIEISEDDLDTKCRPLPKTKIREVCAIAETQRSQGYTIRSKSLLNWLKLIMPSDWQFTSSPSSPNSALIGLPNGKQIPVYPVIGVPTALTVHDVAKTKALHHTPTVLYDHIGLHHIWQEHLDWLGAEMNNVGLVKADTAIEQLSQWGGLS